MTAAVAAAIATVVAGIVAGLTGWLTARASARGAVKAAQVTSLSDLEREAGQRAAGIYEGAIKQLERERDEDRAEINDLRKRLAAAERELVECKTACRQLARRLDRP